MALDWKDIAGPVLNAGGTILGGILGAGPGAAVGGAVGGALATALGCDPTPEAVTAAIQGRTDAPAIVQAVDRAQGPSLAVLDTQDRASARQQTLSLVQSKSNLAWGAPIVSVMVMVGFVGLSFLAMKPESAGVRSDVVLYLLGAWQGLATGVVAYWVGSSAGSANKDQIIASKK